MKEYLLDAVELRKIADQAARYEATAISREASLAFNLIRAQSVTMANALESISKDIDTKGGLV